MTPSDPGLGSTRESTQVCTGQGYVVPPRHPALLAGRLRARLQREAGEGRTGFAVIDAVEAVVLPDQRLHLGRRSALRQAQVVLGGLDDRRPQRAIARRAPTWPAWSERQQLDRHAGRRGQVGGRAVREGEPGHRAARAEADQRGGLLPPRLPRGLHRDYLLPLSTTTPAIRPPSWRRDLGCRSEQALEDRLDLRVARVIGVLEQHAGVLREHRRRADEPLLVDVAPPAPPARPGWSPARRRCPGIRLA